MSIVPFILGLLIGVAGGLFWARNLNQKDINYWFQKGVSTGMKVFPSKVNPNDPPDE